MNDPLPQTEHFEIQTRDTDMGGRPKDYFVVQPKREKTKDSRAMVPYPPAWANTVEELIPHLLETERVYSECRNNLEESDRQHEERCRAMQEAPMSDLGQSVFDMMTAINKATYFHGAK